MKTPKLRDRTHTCNELRIDNINETVILMGWVNNIRPFGGALFIDIRDRYGNTQLVFQKDKNPELMEKAANLRHEDVIGITGVVLSRGENKTDKVPTGDIEVEVNDFMIYSKSQVPPFPVRDGISSTTETRLKYRYLDLRRPEMQHQIITRSKLATLIRQNLINEEFLEIETPFIVKYTPGGARNFMVPSRLHKGKVYALAESPQIYKQLLMVAGYDRYFQLAKCFRDEDPRNDRQLEFTQIDLEMSFADDLDIINLVEKVFKNIWNEINLKFNVDDFPRLQWTEAMAKYGTDKPDLRFGIPHIILNDFSKNSGVGILESGIASGNLIKGINVPGGASKFSRKKIDLLTKFVKREEVGPAKGLIWLKVSEDGNSVTGSVAKLLTPEKQSELIKIMMSKPGDIIFIISDIAKITHKSMDFLRREIAGQLDLISDSVYAPLWVVNFPMFEKNENGEWTSSHHPFTHPHPEDLHLLNSSSQGEVKSLAYDLVINGNEVGGGSVRIHDPEIQSQVFKALGIDDEKAEELFGFLLEAFKYGVPPHAGFAAGLDRLTMIITGTDSLRDVIAFPKTVSGIDAMTGAPTAPEELQFTELGITTLKKQDS